MRRLSCLLIALLLLGGILLGLDRGAVVLAERVAEGRAGQQGLEGAEVDVRGFPFLTQLARRSLDDVTVSAASAAREGVALQDLRADLRQVRVTSPGSAVAGTLAARATVPLAEVEARGGLEPGSVSADGDALRVRRVLDLPGGSVESVAVTAVTLEGSELVLTPRTVDVGGRPAPSRVVDLVREQLTRRVEVPALPAGVSLDGVRVLDAGLQVHVSGRGVVLAGGGSGG